MSPQIGTGREGVTVRTVLSVPELEQTQLTVLSGENRLDAAVRWVHIAETEDVASLLEGGEFLLSSGPAFRLNVDRTRAFLLRLEKAGAAAFAVEIVTEDDEPDASSLEVLSAASAGLEIPVIALTERVRFARITQAAHRLLIAEHLEWIERTREVHEVFTELSISGADEAKVVETTSDLLNTPVVLEDAAHRILSFELCDMTEDELFDDWPLHSGRAVPVGMKQNRWGRLAAPFADPTDRYAAEVLERAGQAITLVRMATQHQRDLLLNATDRFLGELSTHTQMTDQVAALRSQRYGMSRSAAYTAVALHTADVSDAAGVDLSDYQLEERRVRSELIAVSRSLGLSALTGTWRYGTVVALVGFPTDAVDAPLTELSRTLSVNLNRSITIGVGPSRDSVLTAGRDLETAVETARIAAGMSVRERPFYRFADLRLNGLIAGLADDARLRVFAESELAPLLGSGGDTASSGADRAALDFLEAYVRAGGNKTEVAARQGISRPVVYARLQRLEGRLGVSLDDAESRAALLIALLWWRSQR
ncbi:PucR family transcriptional regulator [Brevibacterium otitidis]|uniref:PucR family transcriptional regulator n=1 Tax=Brevibacterium otitidis TaxID=53364 RepID=A0ABV5X644_9MICO|nr:PucR family transcriptional regulator [Brevibacterium otitidis]